MHNELQPVPLTLKGAEDSSAISEHRLHKKHKIKYLRLWVSLEVDSFGMTALLHYLYILISLIYFLGS